ncbi:IS110 family transposase [Faecalicatena contorta]|uniref:Transposase n=1 Tax=Faecalicatena contorta TaxID=39482 RepID=A0A316A1Q9_9FIRM|nr:IS110 family transposase [Faecalicatena contorta]PWJ51575.1 transposase [Faecalicatena contorta]SUQ13131.1 Transposase [Faecalicatena contorta]
MFYVGIDVAKDKHDCFITNSDGEVLADAFTFPNTLDGFNSFFSMLISVALSTDNIKVGLEATGHYSNNILEFLLAKGLLTFLLNPLATNLYRKGRSLRKTKTDKSDARFITMMLMTEDLKPYVPVSYHIQELKSLSRHRFRLVHERSKFKVSYSRLLHIIFPELSAHVWSASQNSMLYTLLELPSAVAIASCHLTKLTHLIQKYSKGKYSKDKAIELREAAKDSIGSTSPAQAFELQQTIRMILFLQTEIDLLDKQIKSSVEQLNSPIMSIPGISYISAAIILAEIGDISLFNNSAKLLAFAGLEPSTYQSGKFTASHAIMVKRGSKYLRWALLNATRLVCMRNPSFNEYKHKKLAEGKHYFVALSHTSKKLVRVIYHLLKTGNTYHPK